MTGTGPNNAGRTWALGLVPIATATAFLGATGFVGLTVTAVVVAVCLSVASFRGRTFPTTTVAALAVLPAVGTVQLVPLSPRLLTGIAPHSAQVWSRATDLLGKPNTAHPISIDPAGTFFAVATGLVVLFGFLLVRASTATEEARERFLAGLAALIGGYSLIALLHALLGLDHVYGFLPPQSAPAAAVGLLGPILNPNHAAALAGVGALLGVALALGSGTAYLRALGLLSGTSAITLTVVSQSRWGVAVLALGLTSLVMARGSRLAKAGFCAAVALAVGVGHFAASWLPKLAGDQLGSTSKLAVVGSTYAAAKVAPVVGVGLGAFGAAFAPIDPGLAGQVRVTHAEHWPSQLLAEAGAPATLLLVGLIVVGIVRHRRRPRHTLDLAAQLALVGLAVHDLLDFSMFFAPTALAASALLATQLDVRATGSRSRYPRRVAFVTAAVTPLFAVAARRSVEDEAAAMSSQAVAGQLSAEQLDAAILRHPNEAYFYLLRGMATQPAGMAGPFLVRAVDRAPMRAQSHLVLARWFAATGRRALAWPEYRRTTDLAYTLTPVVSEDLLRLHASPFEAIAALVHEPSLDAFSVRLRASARVSDAHLLDELMIERFSKAIGARTRLVLDAVDVKDAAAAQRLAAAGLKVAPEAPLTYFALAASSEGEAAEKWLEQGIRVTNNNPQLLRELIVRRGARLGVGTVTEQVDLYRRSLAGSKTSVADVHLALGDAHLQRGEFLAALHEFDEALQLEPELQVAEEKALAAANAAGLPDRARALRKSICQRQPQPPDCH